ncbi:MAG: hypothetical protein HOP11_08995 [Saprospiraceae bacterium]|nr:hypothetical protein [Saprospiraceae bacterium]
MIWIKYKIDSYGRLTETKNGSKENIKPLLHNEVAFEFQSIEQGINYSSNHNELLRSDLFKLSKQGGKVLINTNGGSNIDVTKLSDESKELIKDFLIDPQGTKLGILMALHNKENWTDFSFCCGTQKEQFINLLKNINGL